MFVSVDESQDFERFVLAAVVAPDLLTAQSLVGDIRTAARRWRIPVHEFHEADLYRDHPRLLTRGLELMSTAKRKKHVYARREIKFVATYYMKSPTEQTKRTLPTRNRLLTVYRELFQALIWALPLGSEEEVTVIADRFEGCQLLLPTLEGILTARTGGSVQFDDSSAMQPLQLADLLAGTMRRHLGGDVNEGRFRYIAPLLHHLGAVPVKQ